LNSLVKTDHEAAMDICHSYKEHFMAEKSYLTGKWAIFKSRASTEVLGYIVDGIGQTTVPGQPPFSIIDSVLFAPDGTRLGYLAPLEGSWVVNLGDYEIGHVLRALP
jgi:hypothetical protein